MIIYTPLQRSLGPLSQMRYGDMLKGCRYIRNRSIIQRLSQLLYRPRHSCFQS